MKKTLLFLIPLALVLGFSRSAPMERMDLPEGEYLLYDGAKAVLGLFVVSSFRSFDNGAAIGDEDGPRDLLASLVTGCYDAEREEPFLEGPFAGVLEGDGRSLDLIDAAGTILASFSGTGKTWRFALADGREGMLGDNTRSLSPKDLTACKAVRRR